jgi:peptidoglycan/LPS O-acetylase OafA/YrhL
MPVVTVEGRLSRCPSASRGAAGAACACAAAAVAGTPGGPAPAAAPAAAAPSVPAVAAAAGVARRSGGAAATAGVVLGWSHTGEEARPGLPVVI